MQNTFVCQKMPPKFIEFLIAFLQEYESEAFNEFFLEIENNQELKKHIDERRHKNNQELNDPVRNNQNLQ